MSLSNPSQQILITEQTSKKNLVELGIRLRKLLECSKKSNKSRQEVKRLARLVDQERTHCDPDKAFVLHSRWAAKRDGIVRTKSHSRSNPAFCHMKQQHEMDSSRTFPQSWTEFKSNTRKVSISPSPMESSLPRLETQPCNGRLSPPPTETFIFTKGNDGSLFSPLIDKEVQKFQSQFFPSW